MLSVKIGDLVKYKRSGDLATVLAVNGKVVRIWCDNKTTWVLSEDCEVVSESR